MRFWSFVNNGVLTTHPAWGNRSVRLRNYVIALPFSITSPPAQIDGTLRAVGGTII